MPKHAGGRVKTPGKPDGIGETGRSKMQARYMSMAGVLVAGSLLAPVPTLAQISDDVVKIGVLTDMNGPAATSTGQGSMTAAQMAVEDFGGTVLDKPISAVGLAIQNMATEKKRLFIASSTGTADFHGKFCSPHAIQWVFDTR